ncbi:uncharacterized protein LOC120111730 [Phoenix dactylifera]|uniref:Uncharacterized protein LOC103702973 n=1 Tax=Phoenix dactylifera TaxID=42345 RepID=A0A8B9AIC1_PHODC|nr:uncharacterized protein LOC103702973 [Phoenix dactylifera]XP_038985532.1 uncharacterized protein LOC120111730 [Phoenix dactylifera]
MGNCMETCSPRLEEGEVKPRGVGESGVGVGKEGGFKVKILLTRGELEWLMLQMEKGEKTLEDVLMEMGRERREGAGKAQGWKPSLESIIEVPEVQSFDAGE